MGIIFMKFGNMNNINLLIKEFPIYSPIINFLKSVIGQNNIKSELKDSLLIYSIYDSLKIKFDFKIILWLDEFYPRVTIYLGSNSSLLYSEMDDLIGDDVEIDYILLLLKSLLSHKIVVVLSELDKKLIEQKISYYYCDSYVDVIYSKKMFIFPWKKKFITKKEYIFEPWINNLNLPNIDFKETLK